MKRTIPFVFLSMMISCFAFAEDMVRIPAAGNTVVGYVGCDVDATECTASSVKKSDIPAFEIDIHPVTVGEYALCVNVGKCEKLPTHSMSELTGTTESHSINSADKPNYPAVVSYDMAEAYCRYVGKSLPTEKQWLAAAMGNEVKAYAWGNDDEATAAIRQPGIDDFSALSDVMSMPKDFVNGLYDMSGNGYEWIDAKPLGKYETGGSDGDIACIDSRTRVCLGAAPLPLYRKIGVWIRSYATFRCVK
ncbi:MAG: formylglycine-generating enzyme family protein [Proteobacteria bacterium]|nr:formylglycine-generating enzyme family protein [Pseudomonadota bacterium]